MLNSVNFFSFSLLRKFAFYFKREATEEKTRIYSSFCPKEFKKLFLWIGHASLFWRFIIMSTISVVKDKTSIIWWSKVGAYELNNENLPGLNWCIQHRPSSLIDFKTWLLFSLRNKFSFTDCIKYKFVLLERFNNTKDLTPYLASNVFPFLILFLFLTLTWLM